MLRFCGGFRVKRFASAGNYRRFAHPCDSWETRSMKADPILEEVWRIKDELAREAGYDVRRLCENTRKRAAEHPHPGPVLRSAEELRQFIEEEERKHATTSSQN